MQGLRKHDGQLAHDHHVVQLRRFDHPLAAPGIRRGDANDGRKPPARRHSVDVAQFCTPPPPLLNKHLIIVLPIYFITHPRPPGRSPSSLTP